MDLTPISYEVTLTTNGETIKAVLNKSSTGIFEIQASSFHKEDSARFLNVSDIANFMKTLCTEHGKNFTNDDYPCIILVFPNGRTYNLPAQTFAKWSVDEVLRNFTDCLPFQPFVD